MTGGVFGVGASDIAETYPVFGRSRFSPVSRRR